jgi:hypothetical protein
MKPLPITHPAKWLISSLLILITLALTLTRVETLSAHPPQQKGDQPQFVGAIQSSPDGSAVIETQEAQLDLTYFTATGELIGLVPTAAGMALTEGENEGSYTSGVIYSPLDFTTDVVPLWGADLPEGTELRLETRLSLDGGAAWSDWLENPEAFYPVREDLHSGNLIWAGSEQAALQFRVTLRGTGVSPILKSVAIVFSDTSQGPTDGEIASQMADMSIAAGQTCPVQKPAIVPRTQWGCPYMWSPRRPPVYAPVTHIIIHQTETPNSPYPYSSYAGWVRSIWNFHTNILWWGDIGYNYLIDPNGVIYEGRAGGDDVIGIHDGINAGSMGIGFIGCYGNCDNPRLTVAEPSEAMLNSAVELMAWKVNQQGLDPLGSSDYGHLNDIPVIAGGRDVSWTTSPGDNIYNRLDELRGRVAGRIEPCIELQACRISSVIFGKESYQAGETIDFTVRLVDSVGNPLPGANVTATLSISPTATELSVDPQASTGFGLEDRAGEYDGDYNDTNIPGLYNFIFLATDPTGQKFAPCSGSGTVPVTGEATPTATPTATGTPPTSTPTNTPTSTPTPTPTPTTTPPTGTVVRVDPQNLTLPICSSEGTTSVRVENVSDLAAVQLELSYDPAIIQVIDANPGQAGVQVTVGSAFAGGFIAQNSVDTTNGRITFAATLLSGGVINGNAELISVDWEPLAAGTSALTLEDVILVRSDAQVISFTSQHGAVEVITNCTGVSGTLSLQGRTDHSGVMITGGGQQAQTGADGAFTINSTDQLNFSFPGYLSARADMAAGQFSPGAGEEPVYLGTLTLLAGDVNADNQIDIIDLTYIAGHYHGTDSLADLNGDGRVDLIDLVLAAGNYGRSGPLTNWE